MLSKKLIMEEKIMGICKKDITVFEKGTVFDRITVINHDSSESMLCGPVTFHGYTDRCELLLSSGCGRYYFTVCDGWGVEDNCLYALSVGAIKRDFKKPVTVEDIESGVKKAKEQRGVYSALAAEMQLRQDKEILKVLKQYKIADSVMKPSIRNIGENISNSALNGNLRTDMGIVTDLSDVSTAALVKELSERAAVQKLNAEPYQQYEITVGGTTVSDTGPVVILRVWD